MNIEEAVEWLEIIKEGYEYGDIDSAVTIKGYKRCVEAIETVLNELDKKNKVIDMIVNTIVGDRKILKLVCNKIINKKEDECFEQNKLCDDCIKEYFYKKAEDK